MGPNFFPPRDFSCCAIDGSGREARTCRRVVGRSSLVETRGYGPLPPTRYQLQHYVEGCARHATLSYNRHAASAHQRRVEVDWNTCQCTPCCQRRRGGDYPPSLGKDACVLRKLCIFLYRPLSTNSVPVQYLPVATHADACVVAVRPRLTGCIDVCGVNGAR